jgi:hypothetical protein
LKSTKPSEVTAKEATAKFSLNKFRDDREDTWLFGVVMPIIGIVILSLFIVGEAYEMVYITEAPRLFIIDWLKELATAKS